MRRFISVFTKFHCSALLLTQLNLVHTFIICFSYIYFNITLPFSQAVSKPVGFKQTQYEGLSKSFRTGRLEREMQIVQLSATRCSCIGILSVSLVSFAAITLCVASQQMFIVVVRCYCLFRYRLSTETFGYTLVVQCSACSSLWTDFQQ
jgi:hypothetical protein